MACSFSTNETSESRATACAGTSTAMPTLETEPSSATNLMKHNAYECASSMLTSGTSLQTSTHYQPVSDEQAWIRPFYDGLLRDGADEGWAP